MFQEIKPKMPRSKADKLCYKYKYGRNKWVVLTFDVKTRKWLTSGIMNFDDACWTVRSRRLKIMWGEPLPQI